MSSNTGPSPTLVEIGPLYDVHLDVAPSPSFSTKKASSATSRRSGERVASSVCGGLHNATAEEVAQQMSTAKKKLAIVASMCLVFMVGEVVGGLYANSLAILTDAAHLLSDLAGFLISLFAVWLSNRTPTARLSFGFYRAEILGALTSVLMIWFVTGILLYEAVQRVLNPVAVDGRLMFIVASVGLCINGAMGVVLHSSGIPHGHGHGHGRSHGHGLSHGHAHAHASPVPVEAADAHAHAHGCVHGSGTTDHNRDRIHVSKTSPTPTPVPALKTAKIHDEDVMPGTAIVVVPVPIPIPVPLDNNMNDASLLPSTAVVSLPPSQSSSASSLHVEFDSHKQLPSPVNVNIRAAFIHVLGDALQSVGVMASAAIIWAHPEWHIADPICTFVFCVVVLSTTLGLVRQCIRILMEASPENVDSDDVEHHLRQLPGVADVHDLHIWSLTVGKPSLTAHIAVQGSSQGVLQAASQLLASRYNIHHVTIQVELTQDRVRCNPGCQPAGSSVPSVSSAQAQAQTLADSQCNPAKTSCSSKSNSKQARPTTVYYL